MISGISGEPAKPDRLLLRPASRPALEISSSSLGGIRPITASSMRGLLPDVSDVRRLPPVTKAELMANFDEWVMTPY